MTLAFPVLDTQRAQNSLLAQHHSNYETIKSRRRLISRRNLRLNVTNFGITFPLGSRADFDVPLTPPRTLSLSASHLPIVPSSDKAEAFETTLSDTLLPTSL